jgi:pyridoxamine 5'-phosphate oxidase
MDISDYRREYTQTGLSREGLLVSPILQFEQWFKQACDVDIIDANAMTLATVSAQGKPSIRTVLLKDFDESGFVFFTNYASQKAMEIAENANVALLFAWTGLERQIEISGRAEKISSTESLAYFSSRPQGSQLGAWVSKQSRVITTRQALELQWQTMKNKFKQGEIPLPDFWGGYRVIPEKIEFWQGRVNRLHDRFEYLRESPADDWKVQRLAP